MRLGSAVRAALRVLLVVSAAQIALYAWGLSMFADAADAGEVEKLDAYDTLDLGLSVAMLLAMVVAGITWMVWQYQLAKAVPRSDIRRGPGWHAWSWITPVVGLWFPYQNIKDLWLRRLRDRGHAILGFWWAAFVVTNFLDRVYLAREDPETIPELESLVTLELVSVLISVLALVLAIRIHRMLSDAERFAQQESPRTAPVNPGASPGG